MIKLSNEYLRVDVNSHGAEICNVEYMGQKRLHDGVNFWQRTAPVLFPIVGGLIDNKYTHNGISYTMNQHGFARDMEFEINQISETEAICVLTSNDETKTKYPFDFIFKIKYVLSSNILSTSYIVENKSDEIMYYSVGAHPAYNIDFSKDVDILVGGSNEMYQLSKKGIVKRTDCIDNFKLDYSEFKNDALIYSSLDDENFVNIKVDGKDFIRVEYTDMKQLGLWTPLGVQAPFICIEPWVGMADLANRKDDLLSNKDFINKLEINETKTCTYDTIFN